jgi:adenine-specific DNA-methyltransferase
MGAESAREIPSSEQTLQRRLRDLRQVSAALQTSPMTPLQICAAIIENRLVEPEVRSFFSGLPEDEKHYWVSSLYALLMPEPRRRRLAAYFTPPHLAHHAIDMLIEAGLEPGRHRILDPASGGAAFLVPLAARIARQARGSGVPPVKIKEKIESTLAGIEIEPRLAELSRLLLVDSLRKEIGEAANQLKLPIRRGNTLKLPVPEIPYDGVLGNPPYGRVFRPSRALLARFASVVSDGYVNLYALFIETALQSVRPGGLIGLIVPLSFVGGAYFARLRKRILETAHVLRLDPIDKRSDVFLDVLYDVGILVLKKRKGASERCPRAKSSLLMIDQPDRNLGYLDLPAQASERLWGIPDGGRCDELFQDGLETLSDYGYQAKTGYFVWNREQKRYRVGKKPRRNEVPLYWAHNVKANALCHPHDGERGTERIGFVKIEKDCSAIIRSDAIVLQRTSNRRQKRRLIAGLVRKAKVPGGRGFVSENHTIVIVPDPAKEQRVTLKRLCRLLNSAPVDARFRRMSGTVSVSTKALRDLPLPEAGEVNLAFAKGSPNEEKVEAAYARSVARGGRRGEGQKKIGAAEP